jgi:hypothetical protein
MRLSNGLQAIQIKKFLLASGSALTISQSLRSHVLHAYFPSPDSARPGFSISESVRRDRGEAKALFAATRNAYEKSTRCQRVGGDDANHPGLAANQVVDDEGLGAARPYLGRRARANQGKRREAPMSDRSMVWRLEATGGAIASPRTETAQRARSRRSVPPAPKRISGLRRQAPRWR